MKKANKTPFIILLCIAFLFFAVTLALLFIPEKKSLKITEKAEIVSVDGGYAFHGKIKNVTKDEIVLTNSNFQIHVSFINSSGYKNVNVFRIYQDAALKPDEEFDLSKISVKLFDAQNAKIDKIIYEPDNRQQAIYGGSIVNGNLAVFALLSGIIGLGMLLIAVAVYVNEKRKIKRINNVICQMRQTLENGIYAEGKYGNKAKNRTAAAKTTASVFGAIISALFIGFGRYKVYSQSGGDEFIITENSVYMYLNGKFQNVTNELKSAFINPAITEKKNKIHIIGNDKNIFLTLRAEANDKAQILTDLKNIFENQG